MKRFWPAAAAYSDSSPRTKDRAGNATGTPMFRDMARGFRGWP
jgi:hypothetical protein